MLFRKLDSKATDHTVKAIILHHAAEKEGKKGTVAARALQRRAKQEVKRSQDLEHRIGEGKASLAILALFLGALAWIFIR